MKISELYNLRPILSVVAKIILTQWSPDQRACAICAFIRGGQQPSPVKVLRTSKYVKGKAKRCHRLIDAKPGHDKSVSQLVTQIAEPIKSFIAAEIGNGQLFNC